MVYHGVSHIGLCVEVPVSVAIPAVNVVAVTVTAVALTVGWPTTDYMIEATLQTRMC